MFALTQQRILVNIKSDLKVKASLSDEFSISFIHQVKKKPDNERMDKCISWRIKNQRKLNIKKNRKILTCLIFQMREAVLTGCRNAKWTVSARKRKKRDLITFNKKPGGARVYIRERRKFNNGASSLVSPKLETYYKTWLLLYFG